MNGRRLLALVVALCATAVSSCDDDPLPKGLPIAEAERARQLKLLVRPPVVTVTREEYAAQQAKSGEQTSDARVRYLHDTYGRLGYFPREYDVRGVQGQTSALFAAFYSPRDKQITLIGEPPEFVVVHELVHVLQDQHFDLEDLHESAVTTDEEAAKSALIEGDARVAEYRHIVLQQGRPQSVVGQYVNRGQAYEDAVATLNENSALPPFFLAYPAFAYTLGSAYVFELLGAAFGPRWELFEVDAAFVARRPHTTKAVMRKDHDDKVVPVGLTRIPGELAGFYGIETVDRLGEWYTFLLFFKELAAQTGALPPSTSSSRPRFVIDDWLGDQLVVLFRRDTRVIDGVLPHGLVWTSRWRTENDAIALENMLQGLHGLQRIPDADDHAYIAKDGEPVWLERREGSVAIVKNIEIEHARVLADKALSTADEQKKLPIQRQVSQTPRRFPCARRPR